MHFNFNWTTSQVLWTLTFAADLVLLVVLLGRERTKRFKWFSIAIVIEAFRLLASRLLFHKIDPMAANRLFVSLDDLSALVSLLVLAELAWRVFRNARRRSVIIAALAVIAIAGGVLYKWGPWPAWKTLTADSHTAVLQLMELASRKVQRFADLLTIELGLLVVAFGRRYKAGWRSHAQRVVIGLSTAAISLLLVQGLWQLIALKAVPHSQAEYDRLLGLGEKISNANGFIYVAVLIWWIVCLWIDEPGAAAIAEIAAPPEPKHGISAAPEEIPAERAEVHSLEESIKPDLRSSEAHFQENKIQKES